MVMRSVQSYVYLRKEEEVAVNALININISHQRR